MAILWMATAAVFGAAGQILFKQATETRTGFISILLSPHALLGMACYLSVMGLFVQAFRRGGSVAALYPVYASTFIWAAVFAWLFHHHPIRPVHVGGMALLVAGMYLMGQ